MSVAKLARGGPTRAQKNKRNTLKVSPSFGVKIIDTTLDLVSPCTGHGCIPISAMIESLQETFNPPIPKKNKSSSCIETLDHGVDNSNGQGPADLIRQEEKTLESSSCTNDATATPPKSVRFDAVQIHEHASILGCNPGGKSGPPLSISWKALNTQSLSLEEYEETRGPRQKAADMRLSEAEREQLLAKVGFDAMEIQLAAEIAQAVRDAREKSFQDNAGQEVGGPTDSSTAAVAYFKDYFEEVEVVSMQKNQQQNPTPHRSGLLRGLFRSRSGGGTSCTSTTVTEQVAKAA